MAATVFGLAACTTVGPTALRVGVLGATAAIDLALTHGLLTVTSQLALRPVWRREELEADRIGLLLAREAGYDAQIILQTWPTYAAAAPASVWLGLGAGQKGAVSCCEPSPRWPLIVRAAWRFSALSGRRGKVPAAAAGPKSFLERTVQIAQLNRMNDVYARSRQRISAASWAIWTFRRKKATAWQA